jgi:hypothetical protein
VHRETVRAGTGERIDVPDGAHSRDQVGGDDRRDL